MTSQIVSDTIDETFPVAGQDNDSQGFRDNFNIIKDGLATASAEITDLQNNTAKINEDNNFNGSLVDNAKTNRLCGLVYSTSTVGSATVTIDFAAGEYQIVTVTRDCTLRFQNWPDDNTVYAKLRIALVPENLSVYNVAFFTTSGNVKSQEGLSTISVGSESSISTTIVDAWTAGDGTNDIYINVLGNFR